MKNYFFCEKCQAPFGLFDELEVHMLTEHFDEGSKSSEKLEEKATTTPNTEIPVQATAPADTPMETDDK